MVSTLFRQVAFEQEMLAPIFGASGPRPVIDCWVSRTGAVGIVSLDSTGSSAVRDLPRVTQVNVWPASSFVTRTEDERSPEIRDGEVQYVSVLTVFSDHVPGSQLNVEPTRAVPLIDARSVLVGAAWL